MSYREYFDIDPEYFPQVDKKIIEEQPDLWKKFYPHPTFIKLLKSMVDVLSRKQKLSVSLPWFPMMKSQQQERYLEL